MELKGSTESGIGKKMLEKVISFFDINDYKGESLSEGSVETTNEENPESQSFLNQFEFGFADQHVIFSKPVKITIDVSSMAAEEGVRLLVKHQGDLEFSNHGLSTDPATQCLADGSPTLPGNTTRAVGGKAVFYTCGASNFLLEQYSLVSGTNGEVRALAVQSDGKIIIGGDFTTVAGVSRNYIARLNSDGSLDESFNPNANGAIYSLFPHGTGVIVGGGFTSI